ncbi:uncharacterized protein LOC108832127 [Raphanus sativus]|uniref:Uncharacterized protein LOC108832127 n=1 Tax=Raphanus sativus TaxID=3726 RepID=A0A6J0LMB1_RAPSA|nr:uncharacterized protein LOC108832127 [Raphanus sativus]
MSSPSSYEDDAIDDQIDDTFEDMFDQQFDQMYDAIVHGAANKQNKRAYIEREREQEHNQLWNDYFSDHPTYPPEIFRRHFRMTKPLFLSIVDRLSNEVPYFEQRRNAHRRYGQAADTYDEYLRLGESTALLCLEKFNEGIIQLFGDEYLRKPTSDDLQRLLDIGEVRGFPGMIGSIDCMHWEWKNCPRSWSGQYARGHGKPTIVLEAVASHDLWIWHTFFGLPGTLNDINVLQRSQVFSDILDGRAPKVNFTVNGHNYRMAYYLTDGIYPKWSTFIQSISLPQSRKAELFAEHQESARKDVERAFGILQSRFAIVKNPALLWDKEKIRKIMRTCVILHNMIVENERNTYHLSDTSEFETGESSRSSHVEVSQPTATPSNFVNRLGIRNQIRSENKHDRLKTDLVENIWQRFGNLVE